MRRIAFLLLLFSSATFCPAQLTLQQCQREARANYPTIKQYALLQKLTAYSVSNAKKLYLPQIAFSAQGTYQSDVPEFPDLFKGNGVSMEGLHKEQYKATLSVEQSIWDGGHSRRLQKSAKAKGKVRESQLDVALYSIRNKVNDLFFSVLLLRENFKQKQQTLELLKANKKVVRSRIQEGTVLPNEENLLEVEILSLQQQLIQIEATKKGYLSMLSQFIGKKIDTKETLVCPEMIATSTQIHRPELRLFQHQKELLNEEKKQFSSQLSPIIKAFGAGFYGYPSYNFFADMLQKKNRFNYQVGIKLQWNLSAFYTHKNKLKGLKRQAEIIDTKKDQFLFQTSLASTRQKEQIEKMKRLMINDDRILQLRTSIRENAVYKLANGVILVNDLLREVTAEEQARLKKIEHQISLLHYIYTLKNITNE